MAHSRNHAQSLAKREKFDEAISAYQRALKLRPEPAPPHLNLGLACFKSQR
ncbi:MAG: tetratricopeptide repeat protein [Acidobacteria bacterium]|nr:tetratricopeptide repeat protein [Acidobacteriota bacterium]